LYWHDHQNRGWPGRRAGPTAMRTRRASCSTGRRPV